MAGTRRTPIARAANAPTITTRSLEIFDQMERCQRARRRATGCTLDDDNLCLGECNACAEWWRLHDKLHQELSLPPWCWPAVSHNPYPPNSPDGQSWSREISDSDWRADVLYRTLRAASKAARAARRAADGVSATEAAT
jgi:hypothetical protein